MASKAIPTEFYRQIVGELHPDIEFKEAVANHRFASNMWQELLRNYLIRSELQKMKGPVVVKYRPDPVRTAAVLMCMYYLPF